MDREDATACASHTPACPFRVSIARMRVCVFEGEGKGREGEGRGGRRTGAST